MAPRTWAGRMRRPLRSVAILVLAVSAVLAVGPGGRAGSQFPLDGYPGFGLADRYAGVVDEIARDAGFLDHLAADAALAREVLRTEGSMPAGTTTGRGQE